jgi:hypothetical protein
MYSIISQAMLVEFIIVPVPLLLLFAIFLTLVPLLLLLLKILGYGLILIIALLRAHHLVGIGDHRLTITRTDEL